jgi:hypothetical protein
MSTVLIIVVVIVVIALIGALSMAARRRRLQKQFGPEYDRAVSEQDSRLRAEAELSGRQRRVRKLDIKPLTDEARARYLAQWQTIQEQFVDSPEAANADAYALVTTVMRERGYPVDDDKQVMADLSVEHAATVDHFRSAQEVNRGAVAGEVATEDLRQAFIHYRALFADLLGDPALMSADQQAAALNGRSTNTYDTTAVPAQPVADDLAPAGGDVVDPVTDDVVPATDDVVPAADDDLEPVIDDVEPVRDDLDPVTDAEPVTDEPAGNPARTDPDGVPVTASYSDQSFSSPRQQGR